MTCGASWRGPALRTRLWMQTRQDLLILVIVIPSALEFSLLSLHPTSAIYTSSPLSHTTRKYAPTNYPTPSRDTITPIQFRRTDWGPRLFRIVAVYVCCCDSRTTSILTQPDEQELERGSIESLSARVSLIIAKKSWNCYLSGLSRDATI
jgi:hypothetical protein